MIIVVMGVSGAGKTTVARALAAALGWRFLEADDLHSQANVDKMRRGEPLDDADRAPWLAQVAAEMSALTDGVVACSALKKVYRDRLRVRPDVRFVLLDVPRPLLEQRLAQRRGHHMPPSLLPSQLATLERTEELVIVDAAPPIDAVVAAIRAALAV